MEVSLTNVQAIKSATYVLEEQGITQITGENSNGKSILIKAMSFIANNLIGDAEERETIINDYSDMAIIKMERLGMSLTITVTRERDNCRYVLVRKNGESISRSIREGGLDKLAEEFGWISFEGNVCLQIFETFGVMPFVNNRPSGDYDIVDYIITDKVANNFVDSYENITYPKFRQYVSELNSTISTCDRELQGITFYSITEYEDVLASLKRFQHNLPYLSVVEPRRLPITNLLKFVELLEIHPKKLPIFWTPPQAPTMTSLYSEISRLSTASNGRCPTCGSGLKNMEVCHHEV